MKSWATHYPHHAWIHHVLSTQYLQHSCFTWKKTESSKLCMDIQIRIDYTSNKYLYPFPCRYRHGSLQIISVPFTPPLLPMYPQEKQRAPPTNKQTSHNSHIVFTPSPPPPLYSSKSVIFTAPNKCDIQHGQGFSPIGPDWLLLMHIPKIKWCIIRYNWNMGIKRRWESEKQTSAIRPDKETTNAGVESDWEVFYKRLRPRRRMAVNSRVGEAKIFYLHQRFGASILRHFCALFYTSFCSNNLVYI